MYWNYYHFLENNTSAKFFHFKFINDISSTTYNSSNSEELWVVPCTVLEGTDSISINASWSKSNVQGGTESISAYDHTENPTINISLKFHEDLWKEWFYNVNATFSDNYVKHTYQETISALASLVYPGGTSTIKAPYVIIAYNNCVFKGYFNNIRIQTSGPLREGKEDSSVQYRPCCEFTGTFTIVSPTSPTRAKVASGYNTNFAV